MLDDEGRQLNPHLLDYKLRDGADAPARSTSTGSRSTRPNAGPNGSKGVGEPPCVPTAGAVANAIAAVLGRAVHELPMTPERVWRTGAGGRRDERASFVAPTTLDEALAAMAAGARPVAGGTDLVVGARQGKAPLPDALVAIHRIDELRGIAGPADGGLRLGALVTHEEIVAHPAVRERFTGARRRVGDRRLARHPRAGHDRRQRDERVARDGHRRPAAVLRRRGHARAPRAASASVADRRPVDRARERPRRTPTSCSWRSTCPRPAAGTGSCYVRLEYRRQMEIAVVGRDGRGHARRRHGRRRPGRDHGARADDPPGARGRAGADRLRRRRRRASTTRPRATAAAVRADQRRARLGRVPPGDGRGDRPPRDRRRPRPRARRATCRSPPARRCTAPWTRRGAA